jgi:hypothetical protein
LGQGETGASRDLLSILALARAGATSLAWHRLAGLPARDLDEPRVATLRGRILKDRALEATGPSRRSLYEEAAEAYSRGDRDQSATYPLVNAASLYLLAGRESQARTLAAEVLRRLTSDPEEPETPYYRLATEAEALLVLKRTEEARLALHDAISLAPRAWEDRAATLRQFRLILDAQGEDADWLDAHRPPRSLHFGGHMSFEAAVDRRADLEERIAALLDEDDIGFGFGALAAGADIIIAETLLARGAEVHAVLPGGVESFAATSVDPYGTGWRKRFDAVVERAATVRPVRPLQARPDAAMIALADEIAMGAAVMNGRRLESSAVQLLVLPEDEASASDRSADRWAAAGWRQRRIFAPRETASPTSPAEGQQGSRNAFAILAIAPGGSGDGSDDPRAALAGLRARLAPLPAPELAPYWSEGRLLLAYREAGAAAETAVRLVFGDGADLRIGGHYGVAATFTEPFSSSERIAVGATGPATAAMDSTPPGTACVTEDFAAALAATGPRNPATEYVGELDAYDGGPPIGLYALKSYDQLFQPLGSDDAK